MIVVRYVGQMPGLGGRRRGSEGDTRSFPWPDVYYSQGKDNRTRPKLFLYTGIYSNGSIVQRRKKRDRGHVFVPQMVGFHMCAGKNKATAELAVTNLRNESKSSPQLEMVTAMEERGDGDEDGSCMENLHGL